MPEKAEKKPLSERGVPEETARERQARLLRTLVVHADTDEFVGFTVVPDPEGATFPLRLR